MSQIVVDKRPLLSEDEFARVAALASTPAERLAPPFVLRGAGDEAAGDGRRRRWAEYVGKGDPAIFERVLGWRGMDVATAHASLGPATLIDPAQLPGWFADLQAMLVDLPSAASAPAYLDPAAPLPNQDLFVPFVEAASRGPLARLRAMGAGAGTPVKLQRRLLLALTHVAASALSTPGATEDFPRHAFLEFPVLARLIARYWRNWTEAANELLNRLEADRGALADFLGIATLPPPDGLHVEDADGHAGGRTVVSVSFVGGARVVYKPRDMALDGAFARLLDHLGAAGLDLRGAVPRVLEREGYGWAEFVRSRHAADEAELAAFWARAGTLLGVLTALGGTDMHYGNVIAAGSRLVAVDLETVLRPPLRPPSEAQPEDGTAVGRLLGLIQGSVLGTCMAPAMLHQGDGVYVDLGALTRPGEPGASHRPSAGAVEDDIIRFHGVLEAGFLRAMRGMREQAGVLGAAEGPLAGFAGAAVRLVFRDTNTYFRLLGLSCDGTVLRDGADRDVALERLARMLAPFAEPPPYVGIVEAEKRAMGALDIPRFDAATDGVDLRDAEGVVVPGMFAADTLTEARRRLAALTEPDEALQARILGLALQARLVGNAAPDPVERPDPAPAAPLDGARAIGRLLGDLAVRGEAGDLAWLTPTHRVKQGYMALSGVDLGLGDGCLGIAVFLAALAQVTGEAEFATLRDGAVRALRPGTGAGAGAGGYRSLVAPPLGIADGLAGRAWGMTALARLGGPAWCREEAAKLVGIGLAVPEASPVLADGTGGLLLAALAVDRAAPGAIEEGAVRALAGRVAEAVRAGGGEGGLVSGMTGAGLALALAAARFGSGFQDAAVAALAAPVPEGVGGWGRGASGRLLALGAADALLPDDDRLAALRAAAVAGLRACAVPPHDGVWNGRAGMVAALGDAHLAGTLAGHAMAGTLRTVTPSLPGVVLPGLLNGVAGVGYVLLREVAPDLPDLLLFR